LSGINISTFEDLAKADYDKVKTALDAAGYKYMDPAGWIEQAALASKGDIEGLQKLQEALKGGRKTAWKLVGQQKHLPNQRGDAFVGNWSCPWGIYADKQTHLDFIVHVIYHYAGLHSAGIVGHTLRRADGGRACGGGYQGACYADSPANPDLLSRAD